MKGTTETESGLKVWRTQCEQCQNPMQPDGPWNKHRLEQATSPITIYCIFKHGPTSTYSML